MQRLKNRFESRWDPIALQYHHNPDEESNPRHIERRIALQNFYDENGKMPNSLWYPGCLPHFAASPFGGKAVMKNNVTRSRDNKVPKKKNISITLTPPQQASLRPAARGSVWMGQHFPAAGPENFTWTSSRFRHASSYKESFGDPKTKRNIEVM